MPDRDEHPSFLQAGSGSFFLFGFFSTLGAFTAVFLLYIAFRLLHNYLAANPFTLP